MTYHFRSRSNRSMGVVYALASAITFGLSGALAKALFDIGWSPTAAVLVRVGLGAVILLTVSSILTPNAWSILWRQRWSVVAYGVIAVGCVQLFYFNAVQFLPVSVALLIEYTAPVIIMLWFWGRTRIRPAALTVIGAAVALGGLALVLDLTGTGATELHPAGLAWAFAAAFCLAGYFLLSSKIGADVPPMLLIGGGMGVAAVMLGAIGALGILPLTFATGSAELAGVEVNWMVITATLVLVASVIAYVTGIRAVLMLGPKVASFLAITEVLFAVMAAWVLLGEQPGWIQLVGAILVVLGVVLVQREDQQAPTKAPARESVFVHTGPIPLPSQRTGPIQLP